MVLVNPANSWSPTDYARNAAFVPELGRAVVALLAPRPGERILDLGCGDGVLTAALVEAGAEMVGVDASPAMVEAARARGLDARVMDGQALAFEAEFDAVFSNAALHWMLDPAAAATASSSASGTPAVSRKPARKVLYQSAAPPGSGVGRSISQASMSAKPAPA
jgi:SAM-dependent methyltransferase